MEKHIQEQLLDVLTSIQESVDKIDKTYVDRIEALKYDLNLAIDIVKRELA